MVARIWRGWARPGNAEAYEAHFRTAVLPHLSEVEGFHGARLLRGLEGDEVAFVAVTFFDSLDSIRAFAGSDLEAAVVEPEARGALSRFDGRCVHYTVVASDDRDA